MKIQIGVHLNTLLGVLVNWMPNLKYRMEVFINRQTKPMILQQVKLLQIVRDILYKKKLVTILIVFAFFTMNSVFSCMWSKDNVSLLEIISLSKLKVSIIVLINFTLFSIPTNQVSYSKWICEEVKNCHFCQGWRLVLDFYRLISWSTEIWNHTT